MLPNRLKKYACILLATALNILFFHQVLFLDKTFFFRDIHRWFYPMKYFLAASYRAGDIPFWCPNYFCGSPFMSDLQSGVFYPLSLIFLVLPFPWSFNVFISAHLILGFCFFYLFIISLGLSRKSALLMSISFCYGGYTFAVINTLNNLTTGVWLPAVLWAFTRMMATRSGRWFFLAVIFVSMAILGGEPQLFILIAFTLFFHAVTWAPEYHSERVSRPLYCAIAGLTVVCAGLVTMVQLGPTFIDYLHSVRLSGLPYREASRLSVDPSMLKHLLIPLHFPQGFTSATETLKDFFPGKGEIPWLLTVYPGVIILPLALLGAVSLILKRNLIWTLVFVVSIVLALGENTPVHYLFYRILPVFRYPAKFMFLAGFSLLVMGAYGFDKFMDTLAKSKLRPNLIFCLLACGLTLDLYSNHRYMNPVCDTGFYHYHHSALKPILDDPGLFRVFADRMPTPPGIRNSISNHHIKWQMMLLPNLGIMNRLYHVGGVPALELGYQRRITTILARPWKERIRFLQLANVKYIISQDPLDTNPDLNGKVEKINGLVYRVRDFLPRAWIAGVMKKKVRESINGLTDGSFRPEISALGQSDLERPTVAPFPGRVGRIRYHENGEIRLDMRTARRGILVVSESFYPGWEVTVDGRPGEVLRLDILFQGVSVDPGNHSVVFRFRPRHFTLFLSVSAISLALLFSVWAFAGIRARLRPSSSRRARLKRKRPKQPPN